MIAKKWFVYMIRTSDGQLYTGITTDIQRRWREHKNCKRGARYFRTQQPKALAFLEECTDRSNASKREAYIKSLTKLKKEELVLLQTEATALLVGLSEFAYE